MGGIQKLSEREREGDAWLGRTHLEIGAQDRSEMNLRCQSRYCKGKDFSKNLHIIPVHSIF